MQLTQKTFPSFSCVIHQEAKNGGPHCGDSYYVEEFTDYFVVALADGLGSGMGALFASSRATTLLGQCHSLSVTDAARHINKQLHGTRGVVLAIAKFFPNEKRVEFSGIGNIQFTLYPPVGRCIRTFSRPGYLDGRDVQLRKAYFPYTPGDSFVMYSDGISPTGEWTDVFRFAETPLAGLETIKQMWKRQNDDMTVIVGR